MVEKKSSPEEEYFAQHNVEKIKELRRKLNEDKKKQAEQACTMECWMKCPKCCGNMEERDFEGIVKVDVCPSCGGIYLDNGELEIIINSHAGLFNSLIHWYKKTY